MCSSDLYKYFEIRCPVEGIHEFEMKKNKNVCIKCKIDQGIINSKDKTYYDKYKKVYENIKNKEKDLINKQLQQTIKKQKIHLEKFPKWVPTTKYIDQLSKLLDIKSFLIKNIGLYEKNDYENVKNSKIILAEIKTNKYELWEDESEKNIKLKEDNLLLKQINHLMDYYLFITRHYYKLKHMEYTIKPPKFMKEYLKKITTKNIYNKLPIINKDFFSKYDYYLTTQSKEDVANFLLNYICMTLLEIQKHLSNYKGNDFITLLMKEILKFEKKLTLFEVKKYNNKMISDFDQINQEQDSTNVEDFDIHVDESKESPIIDEVDEVQEFDEEPDDPFSLNDMDIETDPDAEENINANVADF